MENIALSDSADDLSSNTVVPIATSMPPVHDEQQVTSELHDAATTDVKSVLPALKSMHLSDKTTGGNSSPLLFSQSNMPLSSAAIPPSNIFKSENKVNPLLMPPSSMTSLHNPLLVQPTSSRLPSSPVTLKSSGITSSSISGLNSFRPLSNESTTTPLFTGNSAFTPLQPSSSKFSVGEQNILRAPTMPSTPPFRSTQQPENTRNVSSSTSAQNISQLNHSEMKSQTPSIFKPVALSFDTVAAPPSTTSPSFTNTVFPTPVTMSAAPFNNVSSMPENNTTFMAPITTAESIFAPLPPLVSTSSSVPIVDNSTTQMQSHAPSLQQTTGSPANPFSARASLTERIYPGMTTHIHHQQQHPTSNLVPHQPPQQQHFVPSQPVNVNPYLQTTNASEPNAFTPMYQPPATEYNPTAPWQYSISDGTDLRQQQLQQQQQTSMPGIWNWIASNKIISSVVEKAK
ncbi:unnamed protein product, partial [Didymodactylos carnosus]